MRRPTTRRPTMKRPTMKVRLLALLPLLLMAIPAGAFAASQTWTHVSLMDSQCLSRFKENPDDHTTKCALQCVKNGYGIITADGAFLAFDAAGNEKALAALKATKSTDHLRVTVTGERQGDSIKVATLSLDAAGK